MQACCCLEWGLETSGDTGPRLIRSEAIHGTLPPTARPLQDASDVVFTILALLFTINLSRTALVAEHRVDDIAELNLCRLARSHLEYARCLTGRFRLPA
jgi:hypothetical protein